MSLELAHLRLRLDQTLNPTLNPKPYFVSRLAAAESNGQLESLEEDQDIVGSMDAASFKRRLNLSSRLSIDNVRTLACS